MMGALYCRQAHVSALTFEIVEETYAEPARGSTPLDLSALPGLKSLTVRVALLALSCSETGWVLPTAPWPPAAFYSSNNAASASGSDASSSNAEATTIHAHPYGLEAFWTCGLRPSHPPPPPVCRY